MSTFKDRDKTALMVIDVQKAVVGWAWRSAEVVANINKLVAKARASSTPVVWVQHSDEEMTIGSEAWELMDDLTKPIDGEAVIQKNYRSSFESTNLDAVLEKLGVSNLLITGGETNNCVRHTAHAAIERGYDVVLVSDAHTTNDGPWGLNSVKAEDVVAEQNGSFSSYSLPGRQSTVSTTDEVRF